MKLTKTFNEDEFIQICRSLNYNKKKTLIATKFFVEKWGIEGEYILTKLTVPLNYNGTMNLTATKAIDRII